MQTKKIIIIGTTASNLYIFRKDFILSCISQGIKVYALVSEPDDFWNNKIKDTGAHLLEYKMNRS